MFWEPLTVLTVNEVSNLVWQTHEPGAAAITAYKEERVSRARQLGISTDGIATQLAL